MQVLQSKYFYFFYQFLFEENSNLEIIFDKNLLYLVCSFFTNNMFLEEIYKGFINC